MALFSRKFVLAALCSASLAATFVNAMAQETGATDHGHAVMAQDAETDAQGVERDKGVTYEDLLEQARKKNFVLTREENDALMQKARERSEALTKKRLENSQAVMDVLPNGGREVALAVVDTKPLVKGQENRVTLRATYKDDGDLVTKDRLQVFHTKPIHVMINEPQLNDYRHAHPTPTDKAGEYSFVFTPRTDCSYRAWVDMYPYDGTEQTAMVDVKGAKDCSNLPVDKVVNTRAEEDGLSYSLTMNTKDLAKDQDTMLRFEITDENGEGFTGLQPVMGAFAHLVGFYGDFDGVAHIHPMKNEPTSEDDRGGPALSFHIHPKKSGYMRFFLQVLVDGKMHFIPFGVNIAEKGEYSDLTLRQIMNKMKQENEKRHQSEDEGLKQSHGTGAPQNSSEDAALLNGAAAALGDGDTDGAGGEAGAMDDETEDERKKR